jgi:hypothetical protein
MTCRLYNACHLYEHTFRVTSNAAPPPEEVTTTVLFCGHNASLERARVSHPVPVPYACWLADKHCAAPSKMRTHYVNFDHMEHTV